MEQSSPVSPGLTLERYAEVTAHLRHFRGERAETTLERVGVTESAFRAAKATWNDAIERSLKLGSYDLVLSFAAKVNETLVALRGNDPTREVDVGRVRASPTPFSRPAPREAIPSGAPPLTVEQYASLLAELRVFPERAAGIRARYFVASDDALSALKMAWAARFSADPSLLQLFTSKYERFCGWLFKGGTNQ